MKLSELMAGFTPSADFVGVATNDDFVLAIDISEGGSEEVGNYVVVQNGISSVNAQLNPQTDEKSYLRQGRVSTKTATQRSFAVGGDRMIGDDFQDFACSHAIKFGSGQKVVKPYVFFSVLTGMGEKGKAAIVVNSDGSGDAGNTAGVDINIMASGTPAEFTWSAV